MRNKEVLTSHFSYLISHLKSMLVYILYGLFFLSCLVLVLAVLLQPGKTDAGALFTSSVASSALAPRGTATVLSKVTISAAVVFMLSALLLAMPALTGNVSVLSANPETATETPASAEANTAPANTEVPVANTDSQPANATNIEVPASNVPAANSEVPANK